jgi:hypothetical protein
VNQDVVQAAQIHPRVWSLLDAIMQDDDGDGVIPIVGQSLLQVSVDWDEVFSKHPDLYASLEKKFCDDLIAQQGKARNLTEVLCAILIQRLPPDKRIDLATASLARVVAEHPAFDSNRYQVDTELKQLYSCLAFSIPDPLRNLARIDRFRFFVSTTPDDLLERAINEERFNGQPCTRTLSFAPTRRPPDDKIAEEIESGYPIVFHLFGRLRSPTCVALTESDYVDYIAALLDRESRPRRFFAELKGKHLLLVGNHFQDWLARFFLRLTKDSSLNDQSGGVQYVADSNTKDNALSFFLRRFAKKAEVIDELDPSDLLYQLTLASELRSKSAKIAATLRTELDPYTIRGDTIFISYCRSELGGTPSPDCTSAQRLAARLTLKGFRVWLDVRRGLTPGDEYREKIKLAIERCGVFIPLCSKTAQMRPDSSEQHDRPFFRWEWELAIMRLRELRRTEQSCKFIFPIVIDDLPFQYSNAPQDFKNCQAYQAIQGNADEELFGELKKAIREINRREHLSA